MVEKTVFKKIIDGELPADVVYQDDLCLVIRDINPQAPVHVLVIPRKEIPSLRDAGPEDRELLGHLLLVANQVAQQHKLSDYRVVINCGVEAGQTVWHLHVHVLGGRVMEWPPG